MRIARAEQLPEGFDALRRAALDEGVASLERMAAEWERGLRLDRPGEALFMAVADGGLAGVGAVAIEPAIVGAMRMRHLYVDPTVRRRGVGCALARAMIRRGLDTTSRLTCNAAASPGAGPFWEAMGFRPDPGGNWSHVLDPPDALTPLRACAPWPLCLGFWLSCGCGRPLARPPAAA